MKTIIEMAGKAFETPGIEPAFRNGFWTVTSEELERFAALVRAEAQAEEREACAKVAQSTVCDTHIPTGVKIYGAVAAKAIRARGQA